jgi:hypothetical protein
MSQTTSTDRNTAHRPHMHTPCAFGLVTRQNTPSLFLVRTPPSHQTWHMQSYRHIGLHLKLTSC